MSPRPEVPLRTQSSAPFGALDVLLRDGSTLRLRAPSAADIDALVSFLDGLSRESLYLRFHGFPTVDRRLIEPFVDPDWHERGHLVGELDGRVIALASYVRLRDPAAAEVAFAVADEYQRRGIGTRMLEQLAARAASVGIERFVAEVLPDNRQMLRVFEAVGFEPTRTLQSGTVEVAFEIAPTAQYLERVDERDHLASVASLRPFFAPTSVAVLGASRRRESIGGQLFRNIIAAEFQGVAYPVNLAGDAVAGVKGYRSVADLPEVPDLAVVCLPAEHVLTGVAAALFSGRSGAQPTRSNPADMNVCEYVPSEVSKQVFASDIRQFPTFLVKEGVFDLNGVELLTIGGEILRRRHVVRIQDPHPVAMGPATGAKVQGLGLT